MWMVMVYGDGADSYVTGLEYVWTPDGTSVGEVRVTPDSTWEAGLSTFVLNGNEGSATGPAMLEGFRGASGATSSPGHSQNGTSGSCDICMQMGYPSEAIGYLCMDDLSYEIFGDTNGWFTDDKDTGWGEDECQGGDLKWFPYTCQDAEERCRQAGGEHGHGNQTGGKEEKWEIPKVPYAEKLLSVIGASVVAVVGVGIPAVVTAPAILR